MKQRFTFYLASLLAFYLAGTPAFYLAKPASHNTADTVIPGQDQGSYLNECTKASDTMNASYRP